MRHEIVATGASEGARHVERFGANDCSLVGSQRKMFRWFVLYEFFKLCDVMLLISTGSRGDGLPLLVLFDSHEDSLHWSNEYTWYVILRRLRPLIS